MNTTDDIKLEKTTQADRRLFELKNVSLGNDTNISSPYAVSGSHKARVKRYGLLGHAQKLLIKANVMNTRATAHRTRACASKRTYQADSVTIRLNTDESASSANIADVALCGSVWACPNCARQIAMTRADEILFAMKWASQNGYIPVMVTLTASHHEDWELEYFKGKFKKAWGLFSSGKAWQGMKKRWGIEHWIKAVEVLRSPVNGWHYHMHVLVFIKAKELMNDETASDMQADLLKAWLKRLDSAGLWGNEHALDLKAHENIKGDYLAKMGIKEDETGKLEYELTNTQGKDKSKGASVWQLLDMSRKGNAIAGALYVEYVETMTGENWVTWSHGFKKLMGLDEKPDELLTDDESVSDKLEYFFDLSDDEMYTIRHTRSQALVIDMTAKTRNEQRVRVLIAEQRAKLASRDNPPERLRELRREIVSLKANLWLSRSIKDESVMAHYVTAYSGDIRTKEAEISHYESLLYLDES